MSLTLAARDRTVIPIMRGYRFISHQTTTIQLDHKRIWTREHDPNLL